MTDKPWLADVRAQPQFLEYSMTTVSAPVEADAAQSRLARRALLDAYAGAHHCGALRPHAIRLTGGAVFLVDGATEDESLIMEVVEQTDPTAEGLRARIGQALLGLSLVRRDRPDSAIVLLVANDDVRRAAQAWVPALATGHPVQLATPGTRAAN